MEHFYQQKFSGQCYSRESLFYKFQVKGPHREHLFYQMLMTGHFVFIVMQLLRCYLIILICQHQPS